MAERFEPHAILVADMVGYSQLLAQQPAGTHAIFTTHLLNVFRPMVRSRAGRVIKTTGDGIVAIFEQADEAESCARGIQSKIEAESIEIPFVKYRISVHYGNIIVERDDIFGIDVNAAIHMQALAPPGGICISGELFFRLEDAAKTSYQYMGRKYLKNIPQAIDTYHHTSRSSPYADPGTLGTLPVSRRASLSPPPRVGVAGFKIHTPSDQANLLVSLAQDTLVRGLTGFRDIMAVSPLMTEMVPTFRSPAPSLTALSNNLGLDYLVRGSCYRSDGKLVFLVHLEHLIKRELLWSNKVPVPIDEIDQLEDAISRELIAPIVLYVQRHEIEGWFLGAPGQRSENEVLFREAKKLLSQGTLTAIKRARHLLATILTKAGEIADVHVSLARAENLYGRLLAGPAFVEALERASEHARKAIELDELNPQAHAELALQEMFQRRHASAAQIFQHALRLNPYDPMIQADWADCLVYMGKASEALPILEKVVASWPRDRDWAEWNLCDAEWALNRPHRIIEVMQHKQDLPHVHRLLAASYAKLGQMSEARYHAQKVRDHQPGFSTKEWQKVTPNWSSDASEEYGDFLRRAGL